MQPSTLLKFAIKTAKESGAMLLKKKKTAKILLYKGKHGDFAMNADYASERHIMSRIKKTFPTHSIYTEETGKHDKKSEYTWIIDPLDGTLNYAHKIPMWGVNIACWHKGEPLISVIYLPETKELFHAVKGKGAYLNGKRIHVDAHTSVKKSFIAGHIFFELPIGHILMRYLGCSGVELAYVAAGRFSARIKLRGTDPFGYGAGSLLVTEAGGTITDPKGKPWTLTTDGVVVSNGKIHKKLLTILKPKLNRTS